MKQIALTLEKSSPKRSAVFVFSLLVVLLFLQTARAQVAYPPPPIPTTPPAPTKALATPAEDHHATNQTCGCWKTYRRYRNRRCRCRRRRRRRHTKLKGGPTFGMGVGSLAILKSKGPYQHLAPGVYISTFFGYDFSHVLSIELGFNGSVHKEQGDALGGVKEPSLVGLALDFKFRLAEPGRGAKIVPFLQAGMGMFFLQGMASNAQGEYEDTKKTLAHGGAFQLGGGLDFYLNRYLSLGLRVLYRPFFMSGMRCGQGPAAVCAAQDPESRPIMHTLSAELNLTLHAPVF